METNSSISYIMPNLLIGLCKGARSLKAYSAIFHDQLGYDFFRLELSFLLAIGRSISPDAMVISTKMGNTLMFEWTEANNPGQKQDQLNRYGKIKTSDLVNIAAVPPAAAKTYDVVLTLRPEAVGNFHSQLSNNDRLFPILAVDQQDQAISLTKAANSFQITQTDEFFTMGSGPIGFLVTCRFHLRHVNPKKWCHLSFSTWLVCLSKGRPLFLYQIFAEGLFRLGD